MSPSCRNRVHFAEQPAVVVGTGAGPSDDDEEDEDSDQFYEKMDSPSPPLVTAQVNTPPSSSTEVMMTNEQPTVSDHVLKLILVVRMYIKTHDSELQGQQLYANQKLCNH